MPRHRTTLNIIAAAALAPIGGERLCSSPSMPASTLHFIFFCCSLRTIGAFRAYAPSQNGIL
jgi:hypothetical protein